MAAGMDDYITKPFDPEEVFGVLQAVVAAPKRKRLPEPPLPN